MPPLMASLPRAVLRHVVVADNGSTDRTAELARAGGAEVVYEPQRGYGAACLAALTWISQQSPPPDMVAFLDADLADDPDQLRRLIEPINTGVADLVIGSRSRLADPKALEPTQRMGNFVACTALRLLTGVPFTDLGPLRVIRWRCLQGLAMADRTWGWTVEMQYKAAEQRLRCIDIDVPYHNRHAGRSKISGSIRGSIAAGYRILLTITKLRWRSGCRARRS